MSLNCLTHLRCVLIPGGLGFTEERRRRKCQQMIMQSWVELRNEKCAATSVFFAGVDPRERLEFIGRGQVFYRVELELGLKVICWREMCRNDAISIQCKITQVLPPIKGPNLPLQK